MELRALSSRVGRPLLGARRFRRRARRLGALGPRRGFVPRSACRRSPSGRGRSGRRASSCRTSARACSGSRPGSRSERASVSSRALMGSSLAVRRALDPLVELLRATPAIAIVPVLILMFGLGDTTRSRSSPSASCFPVLVNTVEGVRAVSPEARDTASMLHVGRVERVFRIYFPAALPSIVAGLRVALSIGLVLVVLSEFVGGEAASAPTSSTSRASSPPRRCTPASSSSACSATG